jgi:hypothetical protein
VGGQLHALAILYLEMAQYPLCRRLGGPWGWSEQVQKFNPYWELIPTLSSL